MAEYGSKQDWGQPPPSSFFYLRAHGTAYMSANRGQTIHRGKWDIENNKLCLPGAYWPCAVFHSFGGRIYKDYGGPHGSRIVELEEGDPEGLADRIDNSYPYNGAKPVR